MLIGDYRFECRFTSPAFLPAFKGSTLRGALGHALKKTVCALRRHNCEVCLLQENCPYPFLFEVEKITSGEASAHSRLAGRPHPYVLIPPLETQRHYAAGAPFSFGVKLFGRANTYLPHLLYCVELMGQAGLGSKKDGISGAFGLESVMRNDERIYDGAAKTLSPAPPHDLTLALPPPTPVAGFTLNLLTPLRLKQDNRFQGQALPFATLIRAALRRLSSLENHYGDGEPALDYQGLVQRAGLVKAGRDQCRWLEFERYSTRQQTAMLLGGLVGSIEYTGELAEFLPLLAYCEQTHLGKQTSFGLGRITVAAGVPA